MNLRILIAAIVMFLGVTAAVIVVLKERPTPRLVKGNRGDVPIVPTPKPDQYGEEADEAAVARVRTEMPRSLESLGLPASRQPELVTQVSSLLHAYLTHDAEAYLAGMSQRGIQVPAAWAEDPSKFTAFFDQTNSLRTAVLREEEIITRWVWKDGVKYPTEPSHTSSVCANQDKIPDAVADPEDDKVDVIETVIPVTVADSQGRYFDGSLGITASFNRSTSAWVIHRICLYDILSDDFVLIPPV